MKISHGAPRNVTKTGLERLPVHNRAQHLHGKGKDIFTIYPPQSLILVNSNAFFIFLTT